MIRLKIITNRTLCKKSLEETLESVFKVYFRDKNKDRKQEKSSLKNTQKRSSDIDTYLKNFKVESIVLREKDMSEDEYNKLYLSIKNITSKYGIPLFSHLHYKSKVFEEGGLIHLPLYVLEDINGKEDEKKRLLKKYMEIGVSVHSAEEAVYAEKMGATYVTFGHVFETYCKKGLKPRGLEALRKVCSSVDIPVYAIGGINSENAEIAIENGAYGVCIMSGIMNL